MKLICFLQSPWPFDTEICQTSGRSWQELFTRLVCLHHLYVLSFLHWFFVLFIILKLTVCL